jgi:hypothetical protein
VPRIGVRTVQNLTRGCKTMLIFQPYDVMLDKRIAERAYYHWVHRGKPMGSPEVDWYRAVDEERREFRWRGVGI